MVQLLALWLALAQVGSPGESPGPNHGHPPHDQDFPRIFILPQLTPLLPGPPCTRSVEACVPVWRAFFTGRGSVHLFLHIGHEEDEEGVRRATVERVVPSGPGDRAGIRPGDRVLAIDGEALGANPDSLLDRRAVSVDIGQRVVYTVERGGAVLQMAMVTEKPSSAFVEHMVFQCVAETFGAAAAEAFERNPPPALPGTGTP